MAGPHIGNRGGQPRIQVRHRLTGVQSSHSVRRTVRRGPHREQQLVKLKKYRLGLEPGPQADGVDALIQEMEDGLWP